MEFDCFFLGIGNAVCKRLYEYGATVYAFSRSKGPLGELKSDCPNIIAVTVDLSKWEETVKAFSVLDNVIVDGLVNNAGISITKPFLEVTQQDFDELVYFLIF